MLATNDTLKLARDCVKKRQWNEASKYYKIYFEESTVPRSVTAYAGYARSLRNSGKMKRAVAILEEAHKIYPDSERILKAFFTLYDNLGEWENAKRV